MHVKDNVDKALKCYISVICLITKGLHILYIKFCLDQLCSEQLPEQSRDCKPALAELTWDEFGIGMRLNLLT